MNVSDLKRSTLHNKNTTWSRGGFTVYHLGSGYVVSCFEFTEQGFKTIKAVKNRIKEYFNS